MHYACVLALTGHPSLGALECARFRQWVLIRSVLGAMDQTVRTYSGKPLVRAHVYGQYWRGDSLLHLCRKNPESTLLVSGKANLSVRPVHRPRNRLPALTWTF